MSTTTLLPMTKSSPQLPIRRYVANDFWDSAAGVQISGDSGSGKSVLARNILRSAISDGECAVFVFDPPGDLAKDCRDDCLDMGPSVLRRMRYIAPGNPDLPIVPLHPLNNNADEGLSPYVREARGVFRVAQTAQLLLNAWGEKNFDSAPLKYKYTTMVLRAVQRMGLSMAEAPYFFDTQSEFYSELISAIPDRMTRIAFERLAQMKIADQEGQIGSSKNRFTGFFGSPVIRAHLGVSDTNATADIRQTIVNRGIWLFDFEPNGILRPEDVTILANMWLMEILITVFNTPQHLRKRCIIACDEMHEFSASDTLVTNALRQIRKLQTRFIGIHHGTQSFPDGTDDRLLHAMTSQCGLKFIFRHINPVDNAFFADVVATPSLDPHIIKFEHYEDQQFQDGNEIQTLLDKSFSDAYSETSSESHAHGQSQADNWSEDQSTSDGTSTGNNTSRTINDVLGINPSESQMIGSSTGSTRQTSTRSGHGGSLGTNEEHTLGRTSGETHTKGFTVKQQLVPILRWKKVLRFIEFFSFDELKTMASTMIARLPTGTATQYIAGQGAATVKIPMTFDPYAGSPKYKAKKLAEFYEQLKALPFYHFPESILKDRDTIIRMIVRENRRLSDDLQDDPSSDALEPPSADDDFTLEI